MEGHMLTTETTEEEMNETLEGGKRRMCQTFVTVTVARDDTGLVAVAVVI